MSSSPLPPLPAPHSELVRYVAQHPETPVTELFQPYRKFEADLRRLYAQEPDHDLLKQPHVNVVPLFTEDTPEIKVRARDLTAESEVEKSHYIMPLPDQNRRLAGEPATVQNLNQFKSNLSVFAESALAELNWDNVVAAGSSVVNCLLPVPTKYNASKRSLREYYHEKFCPASDVDLFLYGLTEEQAVEKIKEIETSIRDAILTETTTVRTKHAVTICSQYPTRHVQIVLRIYKSVSEILTGFDIDCSGAAYDGKQVYVTPRALQSYMTQINHIDLSRRSPSYENRLSKYSHRNFEVYWPDMDRSRVDPTIFERSFQRTLGLARLLVLERLPTSSSRESYSAKRREERGRPALQRFNYRSLRGNIKDSHEDEVAEWVNEDEVSNYHTFTIPYGPKFHAKKIEKLCYTRDLLLNAEWNQDKKREVYLHRHPAFFGRFDDVKNDCCGFCPKPVTEQEIEISAEESKIYVSGAISFIKDDPGRQQIGSFNPLTDDDWTEMAYVGNTARLCQAIVDGDDEHVEDWLAQDGVDPNTRDYTGRTPLHLAVMSSTAKIVQLLVDNGARLVARLADGRTALHLAAERGDVEIISILMDASQSNEAAEADRKADQRLRLKSSQDVEQNQEEQKQEESDQSEASDESDGELVDGDDSDDEGHSIATGSFVRVRKGDKGTEHEGVVPEEKEDDPDFYDVNVIAWDTPTSALHLAIISGHDEAVKLLCQEYGADVLLPVKFLGPNKEPTAALLTLVLALALPVDKARSMTETLLSLGATCAQADLHGVTAFQRFVENNASELLETLWEIDARGSSTAINHLAFPNHMTSSPLLEAVTNGDARLVLRLLEAGAVAQVDFDTWLKSAKQSSIENRLSTFDNNVKMFETTTEQPLLAALKSTDPSIALELLKRGADVNSVTTGSHQIIQRTWWRGYDDGETALDIVRKKIKALAAYEGEPVKPDLPISRVDAAERFLEKFEPGTWQHWVVSEDVKRVRKNYETELKKHNKDKARVASLQGVEEKKAVIAKTVTLLQEIERVITEKGGKTFDELYPNLTRESRSNAINAGDGKEYSYSFVIKGTTDVTEVRREAYLELFEAAWSGDLDKIKSLTLTGWGEEKKEAPLKISVTDNELNSPFSLAFLRGHRDVAKAVLEIVQAQFEPSEVANTRFRMGRADDVSDDEGASDDESDDGEPRVYGELVDDKFTIENIGEVSMQVKSRVKPTAVLENQCRTFVLRDGETVRTNSSSLFEFVMEENDYQGLKFLLDMGTHFSVSQKLDPEEDPSRFYSFPLAAFDKAVRLGRTEMLAEIIKRTGAGLPLEDLVKRSGVEMTPKNRYYQGLTVYGKKRRDWAQAGRQVVRRPTGNKTSPLLYAAKIGCIESVEWFLSDAPMRCYTEFGKSKAAKEDLRLRHLSQAPGGFDRAVTRWLTNQNDMVMHAAMLGGDVEKAGKIVEYLIKAYPASMVARSGTGVVPLYQAVLFGRLEIARLLIDADVDQAVKDANWENLLHAALKHYPSSEDLEPVLDLIDGDLLATLFRDRSSLAQSGQTPLHKWLTECVKQANTYPNYAGMSYTKPEKMYAVLRMLLARSGGAELAMFNGAGDTPLHTLIGLDADPQLIRMLLDVDPTLLYRENAVGRTPAEVARDRFVAERIAQPTGVRRYTDRSGVDPLVARAPESFLPGKGEAKTTRSRRAEIWDTVREYLGRHPGKRRLVSLHEANDVAKRIGERYQGQRYPTEARERPAQDKADEKEDEKPVVEYSFWAAANDWALAWVRPADPDSLD